MIDGDIVVYDAVGEGSHVLSGGAVAVWIALDEGGIERIHERVAAAVGLDVATVADDVDTAVTTFRKLGFFETPSDGDDHPPSHEADRE